jgi:hypothetical protein
LVFGGFCGTIRRGGQSNQIHKDKCANIPVKYSVAIIYGNSILIKSSLRVVIENIIE